ncbi:P1 family peptidase [Micromonospora sp. NPDC047548]|uniref:P1 family peptidase n=1 Tax=Micromonospora sp. NPDC047548 TaxID=3155624 RepID=UPI0033CE9E6E
MEKPVGQGTAAGARAGLIGFPRHGSSGALNAITDVPGVQVGMRTLIAGDGPLRVGHGPVRTGVTAILPRGRSGVGDGCAAGVHVLNGNGEMTGTSRLVPFAGATYTLGVLVQANFGARPELTLAGVPVGRLLGDDDRVPGVALPPGAGSVIAIVATDAPLLPGQCAALARRVPLGLARTGTSGSHFSGDLFLAFSTANPGVLASRYPDGSTERVEQLGFIPWGHLDAFYVACVQAVEEAVVNALVAGRGMTGRDGHHVPGLPHARVAELLRGAAG